MNTSTLKTRKIVSIVEFFSVRFNFDLTTTLSRHRYAVLSLLLILVFNELLLPQYYSFFENPEVRLSAADYATNSSVLIAMLAHPKTAIRFAILAVFPFFFFSSLTWRQMRFTAGLRAVPLTACLMVTWFLVTSETNFFTGHHRSCDRALLLAVTALAFIHPAFLSLHCLLSMTLFNELNFPLSKFWISEKGAMLDLLILLQAFSCCRLLLPQTRSFFYLVIAVAVQTQSYFWAGITKMRLGDAPWTWVLENDPSYLVMASWLKGFQIDRDVEQVTALVDFLGNWRIASSGAVLGLELVLLFAFFGRRILATILVLCSLMNIGFFLTTGILFWEWALEGGVLAVAVLLHVPSCSRRTETFGFVTGILGALLLVTAPKWHKPHYLGWFDTPIVNVIDIEAVTNDGRVLNVDDNLFTPYDRIFNYDKDFLFFVKEPIVTGKTLKILRESLRLADAAAFLEWQRQNGDIYFDQEKIDAFDMFLVRFLAGVDRGDNVFRRALPDAPLHMQLYSAEPRMISSDAPDIVEMRVRLRQYVLFERRPIRVGDKIVHQLKVKSAVHDERIETVR